MDVSQVLESRLGQSNAMTDAFGRVPGVGQSDNLPDNLSPSTIQLLNSQLMNAQNQQNAQTGGLNNSNVPTVGNQNGNSSPQQQFAVRTEEVNTDQDNESNDPFVIVYESLLGQYYVMLPNSGADRLTQIAQIPGRNGQLLYGNNDGMVLNPNSRNQLGNRLQTVSPIKDIARRQQHNEVERRRRDKINTWINKISRIVPDCSDDHTKQGQSKGGILAKAYEHILELHQKCGLSEQHYNKEDVEELLQERNQLKNELDKLRVENEQLRRAIEENGMTISREPDPSDLGKCDD